MVEQKVTTPNVGIPWISVDTNTGADLPSSTPIPTNNTPVNYDTSFWSKDNIWVPWVNIPIWGSNTWTEGATEWWEVKSTSEPTPSWDTTDEALRKQKELIDKQNSELEANKNKLAEDLKKDNEKYLADLEKAKAEQIKAQEDASNKIKELEDEETKRAKKIIDDQNAQMLREKEVAVADLEASKAQQRLVDEENIRQHKITVEVEKQQSAWAFNKLWLAFSSWIILQSQKIAQDWAYQIARLKSDLVKNQTSLEKDIIQVQNDYTSMINDNINKYNDLVSEFKRSAIDRINSITLNKLANSEDLLKEKKSVADDFRKTITDLEAQFRQDQRTLADDAVKNAEAIRINSDRIKNEKLTQLEWQLSSWNLSRMSPTDIAKLEQELWLSQWEIQAKVNTWITSSIRAELDKIAWADYYPENMNELVRKVNEEMKAWRDFQTALNTVISREKATNPNIKKAVEEKKIKDNLDAEKLKLERDKFEFDKWVTSSEFKETYWTELNTSDFNWTPWTMRTDRHNNPTAFTTDIAKQAWLIEWVDYIVWDAFPDNPNMKTAKLIWDPFEQTIKVIDKIWFKTQSWNSRWTYTDKLWMTNEKWKTLSDEEKKNFITRMYKEEWGSWELLSSINKDEKKIASVFSIPDEELENNLEWMSSSDLRALAWKEWIQFDDSKNNNVLRANIIWAIKWAKSKAKQTAMEESDKNITALKNKVAEWVPLTEWVLEKWLLQKDKDWKAIVPELENLSKYSSQIKSLTDRFVDSWWFANFNPLYLSIKNINDNNKLSKWQKESLIKSFWNQKRAIAIIKETISSIEDSITTAKTKWDEATLKEIRRRYIAPMLKDKWIKFNEENWKFYIDWLKDFYID